MSDENSADGAKPQELQELTQRFMKLWQNQLSMMSSQDVDMPEMKDWMAHWQGLMGDGMLQGGMPTKGPSFGAPSRQWPPFNMPGQMSEGAGKGQQPDGEVDGQTDPAHGAATNGVASSDTIDILRQLTSYIEQLDQRLTRLEQQSLSSKPTGGSKESGSRPTKVTKGKSKKSK